MSKKNFYAVKNGRKRGIYTSWEECKEQTHKFYKAEFKGFETLKEAQDYMNGKIQKKPKQQSFDFEQERVYNYHKFNIIQEALKNNKGIMAYVDGSYNIKTNSCGWGCVFVDKHGILDECYGNCGNSKEIVDMKNVSGEITASIFAIKYAIEHKYEVINIYYDYSGIEMWGRHKWKANNDITKRYKNLVEEARNKIDVYFVKVKAHSGNPYNDLADDLAKKGSGVNE